MNGQTVRETVGRGWPFAGLVRERARPERVRKHPDAWWLAIATVCFGAFMGQLDASIVTLAYGSLQNEYRATLAAVTWVSLAYLLTLVALLVPVGRLADAHGRKLLYLHGFVVFTAASAACGLAFSLFSLVAFRVVQAVGAALMQANSVALVVTSAPRERIRTALGVQAAAQALGLALGPTVGGALVSTLGWRWVFGVNVPVGIVALVAGHYLLPRTRDRQPRHDMDVPGTVLLAAATTAGLLGLSALSGLSLPAWTVVALFAVAAVAAAGFVARQRRAASPLIDLRLLRTRTVSTGLAGALGGYLVLFGPLVLIPVALAGRSELSGGLVLTALPAGFAVAATLGQPFAPRLDDRQRCVLGAAVMVGALAALLAVSADPGWTAVLLGLLGLGLGLFTPANNSLVMKALPRRWAGTGGGLVNLARGLGTALGVAVVTLALHVGPRFGGLSGDRWAWAALLLAAVSTLVAAGLSAGGSPARSGSEASRAVG